MREASKSLVLLVHPHATVTVALHPVAEVQGPRARGPLSPGRRQLPPADARRLRGAARIGLFLRVRFLLSHVAYRWILQMQTGNYRRESYAPNQSNLECISGA